MKKTKRKPSSSQRDKAKIAAAKYLKEQGLLSKQAKLHGGKYISRSVLKKVNELEWIAQNKYRAVPVKRDYAEKAKSSGMITARSRGKDFAIVPKSKTGVEVKRAQKGIVSGVVPVPGGQIYTVQLPYDNLSDFTTALRSGEVDRMKEPKEEFAFTYHGFMSRRAFRNGKELREWLNRYDFVEWIGDANMSDEMNNAMAAFHLYRMMPGMWNPQDFTQRQEMKTQRRRNIRMQNDRRATSRRTKRIEDLTVAQAEARRAVDRKRKQEERDRLKRTNPAKYEAILKANKARAIASRERKKAKQPKPE